MKIEYKFIPLAVLAVASVIAIFIFSMNYNILFSRTTADSARYLISTLVQSQAAIFAVAITLSLVAVQLAATSYSARLIDIFKYYLPFWLIIFVYILTISYGLGILKIIEKVDATIDPIANLEFHISLYYILCVLSFLFLIQHIWFTLNLINPITIINIISNNSKYKYLAANRFLMHKRDYIEPIAVIVINSIKIHDGETAGYGVKSITKMVEEILKKGSISSEQENEIADLLFDNFVPIGRTAVNERDRYVSYYIINSLIFLGKKSTYQRFEIITKKILKIIYIIGDVALDCHLDDIVANSLKAIKDVGINIKGSDSQSKSRIEAIAFLEKIAMKAIRYELINEVNNAIENLGDLGIKYAKNRFETPAISVINTLEKLALRDIDLREKIIEDTILQIANIGVGAKLEDLTTLAIQLLEKLIKNALDRHNYRIILPMVVAIGSIGKRSVLEKELDGVTNIACGTMDNIIKLITCQDLFNKRLDAISQATGDIGNIGQKAAELGSYHIAAKIASILGGLGSILDIEIVKFNLNSIFYNAKGAIFEDNEKVNLYFNISKSYYDLGCYPEAEDALKEAANLDPENKMIWLLLNKVQNSLGKNVEAVKSRDRYEELNSMQLDK